MDIVMLRGFRSIDFAKGAEEGGEIGAARGN
jgi:hypothetical protein